MALRRVFVAVSLSDEVRHRIAARLDGVAVPGAVVAPHKWHLTLRFIGGVDEVALDRVVAGLDEADLGSSFEIGWGRLGAFPRPGRATVLWVGVEHGGDALIRLAAAVEASLGRVGIAPEDRPYRPHLTLSRIRPPQDVTALVEGSASIGGRMPVGSIELYESHLGRGGARYEVVESFELGARS